MRSVYQEKDPISHVLFLEFLPCLLLATLVDRELGCRIFDPVECSTLTLLQQSGLNFLSLVSITTSYRSCFRVL